MVHHVERARVPAWMCSSTSLALGAFMLLLTIDSIIQMCFASSIVAWIEHTVRIQIFRFRVDGSKYHLSGLPRHFILGQIYTTNGAAGTAIVVVVAGILALWLRRRSQHSTGKLATSSRIFYYCWLSLNLPALLLTSVALGYAVAIAKAQAGQTIDVPLAVRLNGSTYSQGTWTPQSWFSAVMGLDLTRDREDLKQHLHIIQWWQYNLILMFVLHVGHTMLAFRDYSCWVRTPRQPEVYTGF
ncbi:hypothetical protein GGR50DRAFT_229767 [Xylaria sp. CBS 124048]|nr:hypothetical protein GGR50DRAFT_229767 [Xylaria sp. CBS 124048]